MKLEFAHLLPEDFAPDSRVWVYQSNRLLTLSEALEMEEQLEQFAAGWRSHGVKVKAWAGLLFGQFVILMADERATGVSGCSTDASVHFIKELETRYSVDFFNRTSLAFVVKDKIQVLPMSQLAYAAENGFINGDTLYFNNLVSTKEALKREWLQPVRNSWLAGRLSAYLKEGQPE
ncbi:MAG TPA: hypothetical protein VHK69_01475 [Chitinophagaceae bacterium]|nr:hypothetical protein [Chitinophagaceae bacterium]